MSLQDQLLKAGLISKDKAKKIVSDKKRRKHQAHRDKSVRAELETEKKRRQEELKAFDEAKRAMDREKNREIQEDEARKAARIEARRLIDTERVDNAKDKRSESSERFNFSSDGKKVRFVTVTSEQSKMLAEGKLAICRNDRDGYDFPIVPKSVAERLLEIEAIEKGRWVYFLADPTEVSEADDEWAAWDAYEASLKDE